MATFRQSRCVSAMTDLENTGWQKSIMSWLKRSLPVRITVV